MTPDSCTTPPRDPASDIQAVLDKWAAVGPAEYAAAIEAVVEELATVGDDLQKRCDAGTRIDPDAALTAARLGKAVGAVGTALYTASRAALWTLAGGNGKFQTPEGGSYRFKQRSNVIRSMDYRKLEREFPDAYAATVIFNERSETNMGALYL